MLVRSIFDSAPFWPAILWPALTLAAIFSLVKSYQLLDGSGIPAHAIYSSLGIARFFAILSHFLNFSTYVIIAYCLYVFGWKAVVIFIIPIILSMGGLLVFSIIPFTQYALPVLCVFLLIANLVLFGFVDIPWISNLNESLYRMLNTGTNPVVLR